MKHLPKHLRPRRRYLGVAIESWPDAGFGKRDLQRECWYAAQNLLGDPGAADADLQVLEFSFEDGRGWAMVRVRREAVEAARAAFACVDSVDGAPVALEIVGVSGTIRACEERYKGRALIKGDKRNVAFADARRPGFVRGGRVDARLEDGFAGVTSLDTSN